MTILILAGGLTAIFALRSSGETVRLLAEERLARLQVSQELVESTLLIERSAHRMAETKSLQEMLGSYEEIINYLGEFDALVDRLASAGSGGALLDLHHSSQLFRNTVNIVAQLRKRELRTSQETQPAAPPPAPLQSCTPIFKNYTNRQMRWKVQPSYNYCASTNYTGRQYINWMRLHGAMFNGLAYYW
ncbi:MAG: hypothetical protein P8166_01870 [Candidatus Thiodiazotropha sp.]